MALIGSRFCGPPDSGNGGYSAGVMAGMLGAPGPIEVTLRLPPPLGTELEAVQAGDGIEVRAGGALVAEVRPSGPVEPAHPAIPFGDAVDASERFPWWGDHPYPTCFVCGPDRAEGDGLRIFPGPVDGPHEIVAAPWRPHPSVCDDGVARREVLWAALDCPSWFGYAGYEAYVGRPLLGRIAADIRSLPREGEACVVVARAYARDGRKIDAGAAVWGDDGTLHGASRARWILVDQPTEADGEAPVR